ncbi:MAG: helix-turn-helix transcriptional regulator [Oscillospiraceae bacterium]
MTFLEKLDYLLLQKGLNKHTFSQLSDIPYTTIDGWYKKGYDGAKLSTIKKIAKFFNVTLDYLMLDEIVDISYKVEKSPVSICEIGDSHVFHKKTPPSRGIIIPRLNP